MQWLRDLSISRKLAIAFGSLLILLCMGGTFSVLELSKVNRASEDVATNWLPSVRYLQQLKYDCSSVRRREFQYVLVTDEKDLVSLNQKMRAAVEAVDSDKKNYETTIDSEEERRLYTEAMQKWQEYLAVEQQVVTLGQEHKQKEATALAIGLSSKTFNEAIDLLEKDVAFNYKGAGLATQKIKDTYRSSLSWTVGLLTCAIGLGLGLTLLITRLIVGPLRETVGVLHALGQCDLTRSATVSSEDELGQMATAMNTMISCLRQTVSDINENAQSVASASEELTATSQTITANAEETATQASAVSAAGEQVSTNVSVVATGSEEMLASIREISKNSADAARVAKAAVDVAENANSKIERLGESSTEIGKVLKTIKAIAQQTNLLALNATIEAARAGEAGKGFAVVANEVKELATETAKATEDISHRIQAIQADSHGAVEAISSIRGVIGQINEFTGTIASAVEEQTATTNEMTRNISEAAKGANEIARSITGVAQAAKGTSTGASETQTAASDLSRMANQLETLVHRFKIGREEIANADQESSMAAHA